MIEVNNEPGICPRCGNDNINYMDELKDGDYLIYAMFCGDCGFEYEDKYSITYINSSYKNSEDNNKIALLHLSVDDKYYFIIDENSIEVTSYPEELHKKYVITLYCNDKNINISYTVPFEKEDENTINYISIYQNFIDAFDQDLLYMNAVIKGEKPVTIRIMEFAKLFNGGTLNEKFQKAIENGENSNVINCNE